MNTSPARSRAPGRPRKSQLAYAVAIVRAERVAAEDDAAAALARAARTTRRRSSTATSIPHSRAGAVIVVGGRREVRGRARSAGEPAEVVREQRVGRRVAGAHAVEHRVVLEPVLAPLDRPHLPARQAADEVARERDEVAGAGRRAGFEYEHVAGARRPDLDHADLVVARRAGRVVPVERRQLDRLRGSRRRAPTRVPRCPDPDPHGSYRARTNAPVPRDPPHAARGAAVRRVAARAAAARDQRARDRAAREGGDGLVRRARARRRARSRSGSGLCAPLAARLIDALGPRMLLLLAAICARVRCSRSSRSPARARRRRRWSPPRSSPAPRSRRRRRCCARSTRVLFGRPAGAAAGRVRAGLGADRVDLHRRAAAHGGSSSSCSSRRPRCSSPPAALVAGTIALVARAAAVRTAPARTAGAERSRLGALAVPGSARSWRRCCPVGFAFGALEVALPAFADHEGRPELAGVLVALWALGSVAGGLVVRRAAAARVAGERAPARRRAAAVHVPPARARRLAGDDGGARRCPAGMLIAPLIATPQRARRAGRPRGRADGGLHVAAHRARRRDRARRRRRRARSPTRRAGRPPCSSPRARPPRAPPSRPAAARRSSPAA